MGEDTREKVEAECSKEEMRGMAFESKTPRSDKHQVVEVQGLENSSFARKLYNL
jgi:hypothetical protein